MTLLLLRTEISRRGVPSPGGEKHHTLAALEGTQEHVHPPRCTESPERESDFSKVTKQLSPRSTLDKRERHSLLFFCVLPSPTKQGTIRLIAGDD